ncbi:MAG: hypothetical protein ACE5HG_00400 [Candidatus Bathyarchaeia archaeon]
MAEKKDPNNSKIFYRARFRNVINKTRPRTVKATPSRITQKAYGPVPNPIGGSGNIHMMAPAPADVPNKTVAIIITIIPTNMRIKPKRNSLNGVDHWKDSNAEVSRLRWL